MSRKAQKQLNLDPIREPLPIAQVWNGLEDQRRREVVGVLFTAAALATFLSLISYPIGNTESWRTLLKDATPNWMGNPGNLLAWTLFFLTGVCAYLVPVLLVICAWHVLFRREHGRNRFKSLLPFLRLSGGAILLACCCALVSLALRGHQTASWIAGGLVGTWLGHVMLGFGKVGAYIVLSTIAALTLLLTTNFLFSDLFQWAASKGRNLQDWWDSRPWEAEFREVPEPFEKKKKRKELALREPPVGDNWFPILGLSGEAPIPVIEVDEGLFTPPIRGRKMAAAVAEPEVLEEEEEAFFQGPSPEPKIYTPDDYAFKDIEKQKTVNKRAEAVVQMGAERRPYKLPSLDLLDLPTETFCGPDKDEIHANKEVLEKTLDQFNISARVVEVHCGPVVTRYDLKPAPGVKVRGITNLQDDLALALQAYSVRIIAPVPGRNVVGIEIPNRTRQDVVLREVLASQQYRVHNSMLTFALGKTISGEPFVADLAKMPHLLVAGATGSGKSVGVNSLIASILFNATPQEVRFLMVDPKRVELSLYQDIPHLLAPVVADPKRAAVALKWAVEEMETRYRYLSKAGVRDIREYNERMKKWSARPLDEGHMEELQLPAFLPYIVIIIDELADLMMVAKAEVETNIARLAQMARAVGMHLVLATQRPSVNIITGVIKANFPSRIAFKVAQINDSRVIIDQKGAESLLGMGDMLFDPGGASKPIRLQGCFVSTHEIEQLVEFIKEQQPPDYLDIDFSPNDEGGEGGGNYEESELDGMYLSAIDIVMEAGQASTSLLQRRLKIGYGRAARILDIMHERGLIGPPRGSKPREVIA
jgi:S-DNA-T family DNA segregation ATPase FtsK/SpoIIIE